MRCWGWAQHKAACGILDPSNSQVKTAPERNAGLGMGIKNPVQIVRPIRIVYRWGHQFLLEMPACFFFWQLHIAQTPEVKLSSLTDQADAVCLSAEACSLRLNPHWPALTSIFLADVRSLGNMLDELHIRTLTDDSWLIDCSFHVLGQPLLPSLHQRSDLAHIYMCVLVSSTRSEGVLHSWRHQ